MFLKVLAWIVWTQSHLMFFGLINSIRLVRLPRGGAEGRGPPPGSLRGEHGPELTAVQHSVLESPSMVKGRQFTEQCFVDIINP